MFCRDPNYLFTASIQQTRATGHISLRQASSTFTMSHYKGAASEGGRAEALMKARIAEQKAMEKQKDAMEADLARKGRDIEAKFASSASGFEAQLRESTYGLVTLDEMKAKRKELEARSYASVVMIYAKFCSFPY